MVTSYPARYRPPAGYLRRYRPGRRGSGSRTEMVAGLAIGSVLFLGAAGGTGIAVTHHKPPARHHAAPKHRAPARPAVPASGAGNVALGRRLAAAYGWNHGAEWTCLDELWTRESGWQQYIVNPQSGADGIAQALGHGGSPATPPVITFPDGRSEHGVTVNEYPTWSANHGDPAAQIRWGLAYISSAYATPCGAWAHETANSWY